MADRYLRDQYIGIMADRLDSERLRVFCDGQTDGLTDRWTFAIPELLLRLKRDQESQSGRMLQIHRLDPEEYKSKFTSTIFW